jgi:hypothetical protein
MDSARRDVRGEKSRPVNEERADALVLIAERSLHGADATGGDRTQVVVHVDEDVLADPTQDGRSEIEGGPGVPAETSRRLACEASVVVMRGESASRKTRVLSARLRRLLAARDGGRCTFPACGRRIVDAHHVRHWAQGGPTELANLTLLCGTHHRLVHEGGWSVEMTDRGPLFQRPDGRSLDRAPAPPPVDISEWQQTVDEGCGTTGDGRVDYPLAIDTVLARYPSA